MGWLLASASGVRERRRLAIMATLGPIALGHAASVFTVATLVVVVLVSVTTAQIVAIGGGVLLTGFGICRLLAAEHRHWRRIRPRGRHVLVWSFLMSSVHGAGLVLLPVIVAVPVAATSHHHDHGGVMAGAQVSALTGLLATVVHTVAMVAVAGVLALVVYEVLKVRALRARAWLDLENVWTFALIGSGVATLALTFCTT